MAKKLKERTNNFTTPLKRPLTPPLINVPEKKIKGILKNSNTVHHDVNIIDVINKNDNLPYDFFESKEAQQIMVENKHEMMETEEILESKDILPEGFFDDPKLDAKVSEYIIQT